MGESGRDGIIGAALGDYQPVELVGSGGMAQVYRARHVTRGGRYALKVLAGPAAQDETSRERFSREAEAIKEIAHPNVVSLVDFGTTPSGRIYLVMEWVDGRELSETIKLEGPFTPARAASITGQLAMGLSAIHRAGFVHRDVKPHNVMLFEGRTEESVKIVDFGLVYADHSLWERLTRSGDIVGTPFYMAPETIEGEEVDARTDLYSLGVILYEMLAGRVPFKSAMVPEILAMHLRDMPAALPDCGGVELIAHDLLSKDPRSRPQTAEEVLDRLEAIDLTATGGLYLRSPSVRTLVTESQMPRLMDTSGDLDLATEFEGSRSPHLGVRITDGPTNPGTPQTRPALVETANYPAPAATVVESGPARVLPPPDETELLDGPAAAAAIAAMGAGVTDDLGVRPPRAETKPYPPRARLDDAPTEERDPPSGLMSTVSDVDDPQDTLALDYPPGGPASLGVRLSGPAPSGPSGSSGPSGTVTNVPISTPNMPEVSVTMPGAALSAMGGTPPMPVSATLLSSPSISEVGSVTTPSLTPSSVIPPSHTLVSPSSNSFTPSFVSSTPVLPVQPAPSADAPSSSGAGVSPSAILPAAPLPSSGPMRPIPVTPRDVIPDSARALSPPRRAGASARMASGPTHFALILLLIVLVVVGAGLGYLVKTRDGTPRVVPVQLPGQPQPRAIARQPAADEAPQEEAANAKTKERAKRPIPPGLEGNIPELERELRRVAGLHGFVPNDLGELASTAAAYMEWLDAKRTADVERARGAVADLSRALEGRAPDVGFLRKRSDELAGLMQAAGDSIPQPRMRALEARFQELFARIQGGPPDAEAAVELAKSLRKLRADVEAAKRGEQ